MSVQEPVHNDLEEMQVYRYKGYFIRHSLPRHLLYLSSEAQIAENITRDIPESLDKFTTWLSNIRHDCEVKLQDGSAITKERPRENDKCSVFELDLDRLLFSINRFPLFRLDCLPPKKIFCQCIGFDSYGHRGFTNSTPQECRYNWKSIPPQVEDRMVHMFAQYTGGASPNPIHDLLGVTEWPSSGERVRIGLMEVLIGSLMCSPQAGYQLRVLEACVTRDDIPDALLTIASSFMFCATAPVIYSKPGSVAEECVNLTRDFTWPRSNICVLMATHLDDPRNFQAAIVQITSHIMNHSKSQAGETIYGIVFSIFHCAVVYINQRDHVFMYTPALQFLPSFYATSSSTPGITALARLGYTSDPSFKGFAMARQLVLHQWVVENRHQDDFVRRLLELRTMLDMAPPSTPLRRRLPQEIIQAIAGYLHDMRDLMYFSLVSEDTFHAGVNVLRAPHIVEYRLVEYMPVQNDVSMELDDEGLGGKTDYLYQASFKATDPEGNIVLLMIGRLHKWCGSFELPFVDGDRNNGRAAIGYCLVTA